MHERPRRDTRLDVTDLLDDGTAGRDRHATVRLPTLLPAREDQEIGWSSWAVAAAVADVGMTGVPAVLAGCET